MIDGRCRTNLDEYARISWPEKFVAVPRIGDRVESLNGASLKVVSITHAMRRPAAMSSDESAIPIIVVELHN